MNQDNFNKLFTDESKSAMLADLKMFSTLERATVESKLSTRQEKNEIIEKHKEPISNELHSEVHRFIEVKRKEGKTKRQVRRLVKSKFNIIVS